MAHSDTDTPIATSARGTLFDMNSTTAPPSTMKVMVLPATGDA